MSLLIALEGIDGSGKTTLSDNLKKSSELELVVHDWRDTELGQKIWRLVNENQTQGKENLLNNWTCVFLLLSVFEELNQKVIKPSLREDKVVIVDKYIDSVFIYQGSEKESLKISTIQEVVKKTIDLPFPDITFVLDIDPQKAHEKLKKKTITGEHDNWDESKLKFCHQIRRKYLELKNLFPERIYIIDANRNESEILAEVQSIIKKCLPDKENKNNLPSFSRVVIKNEKGELLLVKDKKWGWNFPGGKIELGETPEIAACREVFEETNLEINELQKIGEEIVFFANLSPGKQNWVGHFFQTDKYSGEIKNKEDVFDIKFFDLNSKRENMRENQSAYQFFIWKKLRN